MDQSTIISSIVTSLIASIVFGLVFNAIPAVYKYIRIRPRVEEDINDIKTYVFFFLQVPFLKSIHSASDYQSCIKEKSLKIEDFENSLYGKCLSEKRCKGVFEHRLLPVGKKLEELADTVDLRIDRIHRYTNYLSTKEILIFREIVEIIHKYEFVEQDTIVDGVAIETIDPSISYMKTNFFELYELYHKLRKKCNNYLFLHRNDYEKYNLAMEHYEHRHYVRYIISKLFINNKFKSILSCRVCYINGNKYRSKQNLKQYLKHENDRLISLRGFLIFIQEDEEFIDVCKECRGLDEVEEWLSCVKNERKRREEFESKNCETRAIIEDLIKNSKKIYDYSNEEMQSFRKLFDGYL